jgi:hypothetical protein
MTQVYVYNGKEVFLTGRTAKKSSRRGDKVLHEILPKRYMNKEIDSFIESDWVFLKDLYAIVENSEDK